MEKFKYQALDRCKNTRNEIADIYKEIYIKYRRILTNSIEDAITERIHGFPYSKIEDLVDAFFEEMNVIAVSQVRKIEEGLYEASDEMIKNIEQQSENSLGQKYIDDINDILKASNFIGIDDIVSELVRKTTNQMIMYFDVFESVSEYRISEIIDDLEYEVARQVKDKVIKMLTEIVKETQRTLTNNCIQTIESLMDYKSKNASLTDAGLEPFIEVAEENGFEIVKENNKYLIKDKKTDLLYQFSIDGQELIVSEKGLVFSNTGSRKVFVDEKRGLGIEYSTEEIICAKQVKSNGEVTNIIESRIIKTEDGYKFIYGGKECADKRSMLIVANEIKKQAPNQYEMLLQNKEFADLIEDLETYEKQQEEISIDNETGKITINPEKMQELSQKFNIMGYELFEINGSYYLKNLTNGEERKIVPSTVERGIGLEGLTNKEFNFNTNITFVGYDKITHGINDYQDGNVKIMFQNNLKAFSLRIGKTTYIIKKTLNGIECKKRVNNQDVPITEEEALQILNEKAPYLGQHIEEYLVNTRIKRGPAR